MRLYSGFGIRDSGFAEARARLRSSNEGPMARPQSETAGLAQTHSGESRPSEAKAQAAMQPLPRSGRIPNPESRQNP